MGDCVVSLGISVACDVSLGTDGGVIGLGGVPSTFCLFGVVYCNCGVLGDLVGFVLGEVWGFEGDLCFFGDLGGRGVILGISTGRPSFWDWSMVVSLTTTSICPASLQVSIGTSQSSEVPSICFLPFCPSFNIFFLSCSILSAKPSGGYSVSYFLFFFFLWYRGISHSCSSSALEKMSSASESYSEFEHLLGVWPVLI